MNEVLLTTFLTIVETGSFNSTADTLGTKQSTVSSRVNRLEEELEVSLFQRGRGGARLTHEGVQFVEHCKALLNLWGSTKREVASVKRRYTKHLQVVVQSRISLCSMMSGLSNIFQTNPEWTVRFDSICTSHIQEHIRRGQSDIAITDMPIDSHDIEVIAMPKEPYYLYSTVATDLSQVSNDRYTQLRVTPQFESLHYQLLPELSAPKFSVASTDLGLTVMRQYGGSIYLPDNIQGSRTKDMLAVQLVGDAPVIELPLYINVPLNKMRNPKVSKILDAIRA